MSYELFDKDNKVITHGDLQEKVRWCGIGETIEEAFARKYKDLLNVKINPVKETNPYAPDLLIKDKHIGDLKTQNTPFFMAKEKFSMDPTTTVVFNLKDRVRYAEKYPDVTIIFWVDWMALKMIHKTSGKNYECQELHGVWAASFNRLCKIMDSSPIHHYSRRQNDLKGNAKASYVIDLKKLQKIA